jgi:hypothetical protein
MDEHRLLLFLEQTSFDQGLRILIQINFSPFLSPKT